METSTRKDLVTYVRQSGNHDLLYLMTSGYRCYRRRHQCSMRETGESRGSVEEAAHRRENEERSLPS